MHTGDQTNFLSSEREWAIAEGCWKVESVFVDVGYRETQVLIRSDD